MCVIQDVNVKITLAKLAVHSSVLAFVEKFQVRRSARESISGAAAFAIYMFRQFQKVRINWCVVTWKTHF